MLVALSESELGEWSLQGGGAVWVAPKNEVE
jgi:hypothetical protein